MPTTPTARSISITSFGGRLISGLRGNIATLIYTNGYWYCCSVWNNDFGSAPAPFMAEPTTPTNPPPTLASPLPDQTIYGTATTTVTVPAGTFNDPGDTLTYDAKQQNGNDLPAGIIFNPISRVYTIDSSVADGQVFMLKTIATDTAGQSIADPFTLTMDRLGGGRTGVDDLDTLLGAAVTFNGSMETCWESHPGQFTLELVEGSFDGKGAMVRRVGSYTPPAGYFNKIKAKSTWKDPGELENLWIECGKPILVSEYHTSGQQDDWDRQAFFGGAEPFETCIIIN